MATTATSTSSSSAACVEISASAGGGGRCPGGGENARSRSGPVIPRSAQGEPTLEPWPMTRVLDREFLARAGDDLAKGNSGAGSCPCVRGVTRAEVVGADTGHGESIIRCPERGPRPVAHDHLTLRVEHDDLRRQRVQRRLKEVARPCELLRGDVRLGDVLSRSPNAYQAAVPVTHRARPSLQPSLSSRQVIAAASD